MWRYPNSEFCETMLCHCTSYWRNDNHNQTDGEGNVGCCMLMQQPVNKYNNLLSDFLSSIDYWPHADDEDNVIDPVLVCYSILEDTIWDTRWWYGDKGKN